MFATPALLALPPEWRCCPARFPIRWKSTRCRYLPRQTFGILLSLEPAVAALAGLAVVVRALSQRQWLAIVCIMVASAGAALATRRRTAAPVPVDG